MEIYSASFSLRWLTTARFSLYQMQGKAQVNKAKPAMLMRMKMASTLEYRS